MTIRIEKLEFETILGMLDKERKTPQRISIDAEITYDYTSRHFLDYAVLASHMERVIQKGKFRLVEEALEALFDSLKENFAQIGTVRITICKPDILPNCRVCVEDFRTFL